MTINHRGLGGKSSPCIHCNVYVLVPLSNSEQVNRAEFTLFKARIYARKTGPKSKRPEREAHPASTGHPLLKKLRVMVAFA